MHPSGRKSMNHETISSSRVRDGVFQCTSGHSLGTAEFAGAGAWQPFKISGSTTTPEPPAGLPEAAIGAAYFCNHVG